MLLPVYARGVGTLIVIVFVIVIVIVIFWFDSILEGVKFANGVRDALGKLASGGRKKIVSFVLSSAARPAGAGAGGWLATFLRIVRLNGFWTDSGARLNPLNVLCVRSR
jgi:hypothetical protein